MNEINKIVEVYDHGDLDIKPQEKIFFATAGKSSVVKIWQLNKIWKKGQNDDCMTEIGEIFVTPINKPGLDNLDPENKENNIFISDMINYTQP